MELNLAQVAQMCGGKLSNNSNHDLMLTSCVIDSRLVINKSLFVAIKGENIDAHDFVAELLSNNDKNGSAIACMISSPKLMYLPNCILVEDTTKALGLLAQNYRKMLNLQVVAITGSNGKTSVKEMLKCVCECTYGQDYVIATEGNLNNHWGLPLTILRIKQKHKVAILEMGMNHLGELHYLSNLAKPTIAVVNNVFWAHVGFFTGLAQVAQAKGEIYDGVIEDGIACVNMADQFAEYWIEKIKGLQQKLQIYLKNLQKLNQKIPEYFQALDDYFVLYWEFPIL